MARRKNEIDGTKLLKETSKITNSNNSVGIKSTSERCKVLLYNNATKELDIDFKGYGIRLTGIDTISSEYILVEYTGEIGKADFRCWYVQTML